MSTKSPKANSHWPLTIAQYISQSTGYLNTGSNLSFPPQPDSFALVSHRPVALFNHFLCHCHCTVLHCTLNFLELYWNLIHFTLLYFTKEGQIVMQCSEMHYSAMQCAMYCTGGHSTEWHSTALDPTGQQGIYDLAFRGILKFKKLLFTIKP